MDMPSMVEGGVCLGSEAMWLTPNPGLFKKKKKNYLLLKVSGLLFHAIIYLFINAGEG